MILERIITGDIGKYYYRVHWKGLLQVILERIIADNTGDEYCRFIGKGGYVC